MAVASDIKTLQAVHSRSDARDGPARPASDAVLNALAPHAGRLRVRRDQNLALALEGGEAMFLVRAR